MANPAVTMLAFSPLVAVLVAIGTVIVLVVMDVVLIRRALLLDAGVGLVERVVNSLPQAQCTRASTYLG